MELHLRHQFRERFWGSLPPLPSGLVLDRIDSLVVPQTGPGGAAVFDLVRVKLENKELPALVAYRPKVLPGDAVGLGRRLRRAEQQLRLRGDPRVAPRLLIIATETAGPGTLRACEREGLGLIDLRGTVLLTGPDLLVRVTGEHTAKREPRTPLFHGKGSRIVRTLLNAPGEIRTVRALSTLVETSYAYTFDAVYRLEQAGFVYRRTPRSGVILRDPVGLLRAWLESGERTAVSMESFNARSTTEKALREGSERLRAQSAPAIFTLASALETDSAVVTALPHGLYSGASIGLVQEAFGLRRQTPHNFFVLRPEPAADTSHGGIEDSVRMLPHGPAVALPQLIVDLNGVGGRAKEQADVLLEAWARSLPILDIE